MVFGCSCLCRSQPGMQQSPPVASSAAGAAAVAVRGAWAACRPAGSCNAFLTHPAHRWRRAGPGKAPIPRTGAPQSTDSAPRCPTWSRNDLPLLRSVIKRVSAAEQSRHRLLGSAAATAGAPRWGASSLICVPMFNYNTPHLHRCDQAAASIRREPCCPHPLESVSEALCPCCPWRGARLAQQQWGRDLSTRHHSPVPSHQATCRHRRAGAGGWRPRP